MPQTYQDIDSFKELYDKVDPKDMIYPNSLKDFLDLMTDHNTKYLLKKYQRDEEELYDWKDECEDLLGTLLVDSEHLIFVDNNGDDNEFIDNIEDEEVSFRLIDSDGITKVPLFAYIYADGKEYDQMVMISATGTQGDEEQYDGDLDYFDFTYEKRDYLNSYKRRVEYDYFELVKNFMDNR